MAISHTRPPADTLDVLQQYIRDSEDNGGNLTTVVAGTQNASNFNLVTFDVPDDPTPQPPQVTLVVIKPTSPSMQAQDPLLTDDEVDAAEAQATADGKTIIFFAPIFDATVMKTVAVCRDGVVSPITPVAGLATPIPTPGAPAGVAVQQTDDLTPDETSGHYHGNSSHTTGLSGKVTTYVDGTVVTTGKETLDAVRDNKNLAAKDAQQVITAKGGVSVVQQSGYCWQNRQLPDVVLVDKFDGFPTGTKVITGKATEFGKHDNQDEGTGSEYLKVTQTNSNVYGCSLKRSMLSATFGTPLGDKPDLLAAQVEIYCPHSQRFARVPIVDVGPREDLEAIIDLTYELDKYLGTDGDRQVQFRIIV